MQNDMVALSFLQPWLWAILEGHKGVTIDGSFCAIENRTWKPHRLRVGETIALHASLGRDPKAASFINRWFADQGIARQVGDGKGHDRGAIVGTARILGAFTPSGSRAQVMGPLLDVTVDQLAASPWAFGPWVWALDNVRKLVTPVPCKGALGFWKVPDEVARAVGASR